MTVFRVTITGYKILLGDEVFGFVTNEYVDASTNAEAIQKAKGNVMLRIKEKPEVKMLADEPLRLEIDEIEDGYDPGIIGHKESFMFYKFKTCSN